MTTKAEKITLDKIYGYKEEKKEIENIINLLKNYEVYETQGVNVPRGLIFQGPPGTGKTLFAKAIAGECGYSFNVAFSSELEENSLDTLKKAFQKAEEKSRRNNKPVLIYIDELDKLVYTNAYGELVDKDAREAARFLLQKLDETKSKNKILIIASTNNYDKIPHALLRSGRFDKKFLIDLPDADSRKDILEFYINKHPLFRNINIKTLALKTNGMSGADLKTLINNTLLEYITTKEVIDIDDFVKIINEMNFETIGKKWSTDKASLEVLAHEIGHELLEFYLHNNWGSVSALRYGDVGGFTNQEITYESAYDAVDEEENLNRYDELNWDFDYIFNDITISLGGMIAEKIFLNKKSLGTDGDLRECRRHLMMLLDRGAFGLNLCDTYFNSLPDEIELKQFKFARKVILKQYKRGYRIIKKNKELALYLIEEIHHNDDSLSGVEIKKRYDYFKEHEKELKKKYRKLKVEDLK